MNNTIDQILKESHQRVRKSTQDEKKCLEKDKENAWLLSNLIGLSSSEMLLHPSTIVKESIYKKYKTLMERREKSQEPLQYLIGKAFFMDFELKVNKHVLIPRAETETLIEVINKRYKSEKITALDVGTGSGAIAIALKRSHPEWNMYASDISKKALDTAQENASILGFKDKILFKEGDLLKPWVAEKKNIQLVVANLPYVDSSKEYVSEEVLKWEPSIALESKRKNPKLSHAGAWEANALLEQFFYYYFEAEMLALELSEGVASIIKTHWEKHPEIEEIEQIPDLNKKKRFLIVKRKK